MLKNNIDKVVFLIADVMMSGEMNGIDLFRYAIQNFHELALLLVSGYPDSIQKRAALVEENVLLLPRPFFREQLKQAID